jgi:putative glutamine amidotransferase
MRPLIGITPDYDPGQKIKTRTKKEGVVYLWDCYLQAISAHGAIPVVLPILDEPKLIRELAQSLSGLVLAGGAFDIHPHHYGEKPIRELEAIKENRTLFELALTREALRRDLPVLGICGGMQAVNVVFRGTLYQDIKREVPNAIQHQQKPPKDKPSHQVIVKPGTILSRIMFGKRLRRDKTAQVNSTHHQAVKRPGRGLVVSALAPDRVIEGIESPDHAFIIGVQWHPEILYQHMPEQARIFKAFLAAARNYSQR